VVLAEMLDSIAFLKKYIQTDATAAVQAGFGAGQRETAVK